MIFNRATNWFSLYLSRKTYSANFLSSIPGCVALAPPCTRRMSILRSFQARSIPWVRVPVLGSTKFCEWLTVRWSKLPHNRRCAYAFHWSEWTHLRQCRYSSDWVRRVRKICNALLICFDSLRQPLTRVVGVPIFLLITLVVSRLFEELKHVFFCPSRNFVSQKKNIF